MNELLKRLGLDPNTDKKFLLIELKYMRNEALQSKRKFRLRKSGTDWDAYIKQIDQAIALLIASDVSSRPSANEQTKPSQSQKKGLFAVIKRESGSVSPSSMPSDLVLKNEPTPTQPAQKGLFAMLRSQQNIPATLGITHEANSWELTASNPETSSNRHNEESLISEQKSNSLPAILQREFANLYGMENVKEQLTKLYYLQQLKQKRKEQLSLESEDISCNVILYGNPGTGKTTIARVIGKVLYSLGVIKGTSFIEVDRSRIVSEYMGGTEANMRNILNSVGNGVLFIDEAYSLYNPGNQQDTGKIAIDILMKDMEDHKGQYAVILAGYKIPMMKMMSSINPGFCSRFPHVIEIGDYSTDELLAIAEKMAMVQRFRFGEDVKERIRKLIERERLDDSFGNARYVRSLLDDAQANMARRLSAKKNVDTNDLTLLTLDDFPKPLEISDKLYALMDEFHNLVGLRRVKEEVDLLMSHLQVQQEAERRGLPMRDRIGSLHMIFRGNPGTGKTTVARLIGRMLGAMGILKRSDVFVECTRADLVGKWQGHTATLVKDKIKSALGGVLFIDEAYTLIQDDNDTFGKEALDVLVTEMENNRDRLVVIFAGYSKQIDDLLARNPGLSSRFPIDIEFDDYSNNELMWIFESMLETAKISCSDDVLDAVFALIVKWSGYKEFGNSRGVRNIFERVVRNRDYRLAQMMNHGARIDDHEFFCLKVQDVF